MLTIKKYVLGVCRLGGMNMTNPTRDLDPVIAFCDPGDEGIYYQARILAFLTFIEPTIEDELIAHSLGVRIRPEGRFGGKL